MQCRFLRDAQLKWQADTGQLGPFAHCFVWVRPDKSEFGDPDPGTGSTPGTTELALGRLPVPAAGGDGAAALRARRRRGLCRCGRTGPGDRERRLLWLDAVGWPRLGGAVAGPPTDFMPGAVERNYEEPHSPPSAAHGALGARLGRADRRGAAAAESCHPRLELPRDLHVASGPMAGTWSPEPGACTGTASGTRRSSSHSPAARAGLRGDRCGAGDRSRHGTRPAGRKRRLDRRQHPPRAFNDGIAIDVKRHAKGEDGTTIELWHAPAFGLQPGWTFQVTAGCKLTAAMCHGKFDNILNFRGFPRMPGNDVVLRNVNLGDRLNGQGLIEPARARRKRSDMSLRIRSVLAWDDFWVGVHWNQKNCRLHVLPLPTLGFVIEWASHMTDRTIMPGERVVALARDWIGTPYHHQEARKRVGADCLG